MNYPIDDLAAVAVTSLVPYLKAANKAYADEIDKPIPVKIGSLYQTLQTAFKNEPAAAKALVDFETSPDDKNAQMTLRAWIITLLNADSNLTTTIRKLIEEINQDEDSQNFLSQYYIGMGSGPLAGDSSTDAPPPDVKKKKPKTR